MRATTTILEWDDGSITIDDGFDIELFTESEMPREMGFILRRPKCPDCGRPTFSIRQGLETQAHRPGGIRDLARLHKDRCVRHRGAK